VRKRLHQASLSTLIPVLTALILIALVVACEGVTTPPAAEEPAATAGTSTATAETAEATTEAPTATAGAATASTEEPTATTGALPVSIEIPTSSPTAEPLPGDEPFEGAELTTDMGGGFDLFLQIDLVEGESTDAQHAKWIDIISYSHSVSQPASSSEISTGGRSSIHCEHSDFTVTKYIDKTTPKLMLYCCNGQYIDKVVLEVCYAAGEKQKYMVYELEDVIVSAVSVSGSVESGISRPVEEVALNYGKIKWTYTEYDSGGKSKGNVESQWNVETNSPS